MPDIGVDVARQRAEPGVHGIDRLGHRCEVAALDDFLDQSQLLRSDARIFVPDGDGRRHIGLAGIVGAQFLEGEVRIRRLVGGIRVHERGGLVGHYLLQNSGDRFALCEPLPPDLRQQPCRIGLVEQDRPR